MVWGDPVKRALCPHQQTPLLAEDVVAQAGADEDAPLRKKGDGGRSLWDFLGFSSVLEAPCRSDLVSVPPVPGDGRRIQLGVKMEAIKGANN